MALEALAGGIDRTWQAPRSNPARNAVYNSSSRRRRECGSPCSCIEARGPIQMGYTLHRNSPTEHPVQDAEQVLVELLEFDVRRGDCEGFRQHRAHSEWAEEFEVIQAGPASPWRDRLMKATEAHDAHQSFEHVHGEGSAMNMDHAFNTHMADLGFARFVRA
jgi:hypothetical protein